MFDKRVSCAHQGLHCLQRYGRGLSRFLLGIIRSMPCTTRCTYPEATRPAATARLGWHTQDREKSAYLMPGRLKHPNGNPTPLCRPQRPDIQPSMFCMCRHFPANTTGRGSPRPRSCQAVSGSFYDHAKKPGRSTDYPRHGPPGRRSLRWASQPVGSGQVAHKTSPGLRVRQISARCVPHASFIGFTGTPIAQDDEYPGGVWRLSRRV